ncbi:unnamed protein product [Hermetia illucens]|uniref:Methyltransferase type 11 domain-containing protein n=1 Tax=Hermetia illucens TaxID=343691 RepID=A0A7R8V5R2_HERIL|nr:unnamed protein product [Hermetia illucens]
MSCEFNLGKQQNAFPVALCDNLELPFRDESFDAVLSLAVVHHFATTERRVGAIRELARILRIGGRVVISVWALEQKHRRFESQDVLIPWQPPKNRNYNYSDDDDDDEYLPPYHAYTEDSTNSSRSAGDGDSSSLSSSSPGESCYSFVRRAIQKLAGGRKQPWFLDSWNSKDTKNNSSLEYEDAKDLPIELRRLEDFEDFPEPPLSAGLKSRSLGSILNPPPRQIVRSRSSVPSLGAQMPEPKPPPPPTVQHFVPSNSQAVYHSNSLHQQQCQQANSTHNSSTSLAAMFQHQDSTQSERSSLAASATSTTSHAGRRPKLVKQKQSLCDEDSQQLPDNPLHTNIGNISSSGNLNHSMENPKVSSSSKFSKIDSKIFLRKQSSLNEELMAENRLREKERVRKRIQKQMSLNEAFLCRSMFSKRLQVIREGFTTKLKTSTGNLERATKNGFVKIIQNIKNSQFSARDASSGPGGDNSHRQHCHMHHHQHRSHHHQWSSQSSTGSQNGRLTTPCTGCCNCSNTPLASNCTNNPNCNNNNNINGAEDQKPRRHSRESGSDSSKDSSLQSDTSVESEDSFASVIFIPRPEVSNNPSQQQHQQQCSQNSNSNCSIDANSIKNNSNNCKSTSSPHKIPSVPTSPMIMPCPPTPAHSPAATSSTSALPSSTTITTNPFDSSTATTSTTTNSLLSSINNFSSTHRAASGLNATIQGSGSRSASSAPTASRFIFDEDHIQQHQRQQCQQSPQTANSESKGSKLQQYPTQKLSKITRQIIKDLPPIPKFRKAQSLQQPNKVAFPIVRRLSAAPLVPKLMSLEIFNPETDDLDSDSSEPSSPDSIDSVISALKPSGGSSSEPITQPQLHQQELEKIRQEQLQQNQPCGISNPRVFDQLPLGEKLMQPDESCRQHLVDFAEKLSAQLLKELDDSCENRPSSFDEDDAFCVDRNDDSECATLLSEKVKSYEKLKSNNPFLKNPLDTVDSSMKREELRERRLMLANLTRSSSPTSHSSTSSSASSLSIKSQSSKAKSSSSYSEVYEDAAHSRRFKFLRNFTNDRQHPHYPNNMNDTTYLLSREDDEEDENSYRSNDFEGDAEIEHDVIMEEDEDQEDDEAAQYAIAGDLKMADGSIDNKEREYDETDTSPHSPCELPLDERPNGSWGHSNSTNSLDSPSQSGGSTTHHRYYHVFREGELDALINHHVASLHIVSSYYERASWCVVAEKVQVWTI